jgi:hypothetical protein
VGCHPAMGLMKDIDATARIDEIWRGHHRRSVKGWRLALLRAGDWQS